uniref:Uncharacterized protein n=1 Tax=Romanomermis culicivorax TaxID=13658 RepID=A0A915JH56_ROMCU
MSFFQHRECFAAQILSLVRLGVAMDIAASEKIELKKLSVRSRFLCTTIGSNLRPWISERHSEQSNDDHNSLMYNVSSSGIH